MQTVVLLVEDNPDDVLLVREALRLHSVDANLIIFHNGEDAIDWINRSDNHVSIGPPAAIILDLNLPKRNGSVVLAAIRSSSVLGRTPVVVFSSSNPAGEVTVADLDPLTRYLRKSPDFYEFARIGEVLKGVLRE